MQNEKRYITNTYENRRTAPEPKKSGQEMRRERRKKLRAKSKA